MFQVGDRLPNTPYQLRQLLHRAEGRQTWQALDPTLDPTLDPRFDPTIDPTSDQAVVIKLMAFNQAQGWQRLKLFEREVEVLQRLDYPRVPRYRDRFSFQRQDTTWWGLVQDYIPGQSLSACLRQGQRFSAVQICAFAAQILEILVYLHGLQPPLLHRDIKPSNLILAEDDQIYLIDFGAVALQPTLPGDSFTVVGTYGYAPMEQFGGRAVPASDLYALGATLLHLLTGLAPAEQVPEPSANASAQALSWPADISPGLRQWLLTLTRPDPAQRYATARQALDRLRQVEPSSRHLSPHAAPPLALGHLIARSYPSAVQRRSPPSPPQPRVPSASAFAPAVPPPGCQVHIQRSPDLLLIELPGNDLGYVMAGLGGIFVVVSLLLSAQFFGLALLLGISGSWLAAPHTLRLERREDNVLNLLLVRSLGGQVLRRQQERYTQIVRLFHTLRPNHPRLDLHQSSRRLVIQTSQREYSLTTTLTQAESRWLLAEVYSWLKRSPEAVYPSPSSGILELG